MVFSSISFLYIFLPAVLILHAIVPKKAKNALLLAASLLFYYAGEQGRVVWMLAVTLLTYAAARGIERFRARRGIPELLLALALLGCFGLLGVFKYADFVTGTLNGVFGTAIAPLGLALPVGISFYTFQTAGYLIDVYRGAAPERSFPDYACFVTLFVQLVAGPIVRYGELAPALKARTVDSAAMARGIRRLALGLGEKVLIANTLAELMLRTAACDTLLGAWLYAVAVPLRYYYDFSGYSDMAIGMGAMLGFSLPENFREPFCAESVSAFWGRWHITLGAFFRDYLLYLPLFGRQRKYGGLFLVWLATGLWHGASWTFVGWGLYFGCFVALESALGRKRLKKVPKPLRHIGVLAVLLCGFLLFDAATFAEAGTRMAALVGVGTAGLADAAALFYGRSFAPLLALALLGVTPLPRLLYEKVTRALPRATAVALSAAALAVTVAATGYLVDGSYNPFLYFRF